MSLKKAGANYDNEIANQIYAATDDLVTTNATRGSGNTKYAQLDVLIRTPKVDHFAELKRSSISRGDRTTVFKTDDLEQIQTCANPYTRIYVGIKLTHCELVFIEVKDPDNAAEWIVNNLPECFDTNLTKSGNISIRKPETDDWPTTRSGKSDVAVICETIGIDYDD